MNISYENASHIMGYKKKHWFKQHCCVWKITKCQYDNYQIECEIRIFIYILIFIPCVLFQTIYNIWECGLKKGEYIPERKIISRNFDKYDARYSRMRELNIY